MQRTASANAAPVSGEPGWGRDMASEAVIAGASSAGSTIPDGSFTAGNVPLAAIVARTRRLGPSVAGLPRVTLWMVLAAIQLVTGPGLNAEIYHWQDASGKSHYSDRPAADEPSRRIAVEGPPLLEGRRSSARSQPRQQSSHPPRPLPSPEPRFPTSAETSERNTAAARRLAECARLQQSIAAIEDKLRKGYREPRGNKLRGQRRQFSAQFNRQCFR